MFVNGSGQNEHSLEMTFHRCFLPSFTSFGWGVSEEKIKMWKVNGRRMPSDGKSSLCLWQGELIKKKCPVKRVTMWCNQVSCVFCCTEKKSSELYRYNVPVLILIRPPLLKWKTGLVTCKSGLSWRGQFTSIFLGVASLEGDILLEFSYLIAFKIWPYKEWNKVCLKNTIIQPWLWKKTNNV